jgi:hypothetical protein
MMKLALVLALSGATGVAAIAESIIDPTDKADSTAAGLASSLPPEAPTDSWDEAPEKLSDEEQRLAQALGVSRRLDWWTSSYSFDYYEEYSYASYSFSYEDIALVGGTIKLVLADLPTVDDPPIAVYPNDDGHGAGDACSAAEYDSNMDKYYNSWIPGRAGAPANRRDMSAEERLIEWYYQPYEFWFEHFMKPHQDYLRFSLVDIQYSSCFDKSLYGGIPPDQWTSVVFSFRMEVAYTLDDVAPFAADDDPVLMYVVEQYTKTVYQDIIPYLRGEGAGANADEDWLSSLCGATSINIAPVEVPCADPRSFVADSDAIVRAPQLSQLMATDAEIKAQLQIEPSVLAAIDSINSLLPDPDINIRPTQQPTHGPTEHWQITRGDAFANAYFSSSGEIGLACNPNYMAFGRHFAAHFCPLLDENDWDSDLWNDIVDAYIADAAATAPTDF